MFLFLFSEKPHHKPDHPDFVPSVFVYFSMSNSSKSCDIGLERFSRSLKRTAKRVLQLDSTTPSTSKKATFEPTLPSATSASTSLYDHTPNLIFCPETVEDPTTVAKQATQTVENENVSLYTEIDNLRQEISE